jgi:carboxylesterase
MEREKFQLIPTAEPFFYPGGPTGCLLIHGFTGTPKEMRLLGDYLRKQGHTVLAVRLAGHATRVEDMIRSRYWDWLASVEDGWNLLQDHTEQVFVVGFSLGGILALTFSAGFPVKGVVALATPYEIPDKLAKTLGPLLIPLSKIKPTMAHGEDEWFNPEMKVDHVCYPEPPLRCVYELLRLTRQMQSLLPDLALPVLAIHSKDDKAVPPENGERLFEHIGSQDKTHIWVKDCSHNFVRDGDTSKVFEPIGEFIRRVNQAG